MYMYVQGVDKIYQLAVDHEAKSLEQPGNKDYGYNASFEDPFGNQWYIVEAEN